MDLPVCLLLSLITLAVYWQAIYHDFVNFDDVLYVTENQHIRSGLTSRSIAWSFSFSDKDKTYWHPLTWMSHVLDCQLYGLNPGMHHLTSVILHIANSILLFLVFKRMTGALWKSAFIAAMFSLHPLNVDSVAWIAERKNVLSTFFWMLTMLTYVFYAEQPKAYRYLLILLAFAFGLLAKPMLVTLPFVLLLLDYWPLGRFRYPSISSIFRLITEKIPFFVLSAASTYFSISTLQGFGEVISMEMRPMELRVANALVSYVSYIEKMIWPQDLAVHYPYPDMLPIWKTLCTGVLLASVSLLVLLAMKRKPYLFVGWLWFFGTFVPVTGLMQVGIWPAMADRWAYIPLIGLFIMVAWGVPEFVAKWRHKNRVIVLIAAIFLLNLTALTILQLQYWTDSISLFEHALKVAPKSHVAHNNLGSALGKQGKTAEAIKHFSEAIQINPAYVNAYKNLGSAFANQGKIGKAIEYFYAALRIKPEFAEAHNSLGNALGKQGKIAEAIKHFSVALSINPAYAEAHNNLAISLANQGKLEEAIEHFSSALRIHPGFAEAHNNLGSALGKQGKISEAIKHFSVTLSINPAYAEAHINLAVSLASQGKLEEAVEHFSAALQIGHGSARAHNGLAFALARQGKIEKAVKHYNKALEINPDFAEAHNGLGVSLASQGKMGEATTHFLDALKINPKYADAHYNLGLAFKGKGRNDEAIRHFSEVLRISPGHADARARLEKVLAAQKQNIHHNGGP